MPHYFCFYLSHSVQPLAYKFKPQTAFDASLHEQVFIFLIPVSCFKGLMNLSII